MARILIIDDEPQIVNMLSSFLEKEGHSVVSVSNGQEGLKRVAHDKFDVIITDIIMPKCDGLEVLMSIKNMPDRPKVVVMSGGTHYLAQENLLDTAKLMKADLVLSKPLQLNELSVEITRLLKV